MINVADALHTLRPNSIWAVNGDVVRWFDELQSEPTKEEIENEIARLTALVPFQECKKIAKQKIAATDWAMLSDVGLQNKFAFEQYRSELRALITMPVAEPEWPTEPTPIWS